MITMQVHEQVQETATPSKNDCRTVLAIVHLDNHMRFFWPPYEQPSAKKIFSTPAGFIQINFEESINNNADEEYYAANAAMLNEESKDWAVVSTESARLSFE